MTSRFTRRFAGVIAAAATAAVLGQSAQAQDVPESQDPITLALLEWTGQHISAKVAGNILEEMGYNVE